MQNLTTTVGEGGINARHDAALLQALLVLTGRPASLDPQRSKYLGTIDGDCGDRTKKAIRQFQYDHVFVGADGRTSQRVAGVAAGLVAPGDVTWRTLCAGLSPQADLRVLPGSKIVFVAATTADHASAAADAARLTFNLTFGVTVRSLISRIFEERGIVVRVCTDGDRRDFETQDRLLKRGGVTNAGPGESNHNFGQAVDLGFAGLRWLRPNGVIVENEDAWMHQLDPTQKAIDESLRFWNVLRETGQRIGLFRGPEADRPHLQAWSDAGIDMANRLAVLLTRGGQMRWTGRNQRYQCDLGFGGKYFAVGTATQIWNRQATVSVATLNDARAHAVMPGLALPAGVAGPPAPSPHPSPVPPATAADVSAMQEALRKAFKAADDDWRSWTAR